MATRSKQSAGDKLVAEILADRDEAGLEPDSRETEALAVAKATADRIAELEETVERVGRTFTDKDGVVRPSPLLAEIRLQSLVLLRALNIIVLEPQKAAKDPAKVRAGQASWAARSRDGNTRGAIARPAGK
jgi:hypothetical protein